jgi:hypothetical protein
VQAVLLPNMLVAANTQDFSNTVWALGKLDKIFIELPGPNSLPSACIMISSVVSVITD